jgi:SulP family sulfate permease
MKKWKPRAPAFLIAFVFSILVSVSLDLDVATIGNRFGAIPTALHDFTLPNFSWDTVVTLFPDAFTIAFLAGIESLLSCVIADSMAGTNHRSNCELIAQGVGNVASVLFGGIPATGALARTATNVRAGAKTPVSGILHAVLIYLTMVFFAKYADLVPLSCLASILVFVSIGMIDVENMRYMVRSSKSDRTVFFVTLFLTIFVNITIAIEFGVVLSMLFFTRRMIEITEDRVIKRRRHEQQLDEVADATPYEHKLYQLPNEIEMIHIAGPFFFGIAARVSEVLNDLSESPRVIILDMKDVPFIDASGVFVLKNFTVQANLKKINIIITAIDKKVKRTLLQMSGTDGKVYGEFIDDMNKAIDRAYAIRGEQIRADAVA